MQHESLWARGKITVEGEGIEGKKSFNATLLYREPGHMRLRGSRLITSTLFEFIINEPDAVFVLNKEKKWYMGTAGELERLSVGAMGINPVFLPRSLLVQQDLIRAMEEDRLTRWIKSRDYYIFIGEQDGFTETYMVRRRDLLIKEAAIYSPSGNRLLKLGYESYQYTENALLPVHLTASFPESRISSEVEIKEYKIHPEIKPAVFSLAPYPGFQRLPLRDLFEPRQTP